MKKFKQPVSMLVTKKQFKTDLKQPLIDLGYTIDRDLLDFDENNLLVTNCNGQHKSCCNIKQIFKNDYNRYFIETYNPKLFLALAAMTDIKEGSIGEYWKKVRDHSASAFTLNKLYKQIQPSINDGCALLDNDGDENGLGDNVSYFRKATKEEIIEEFSEKKVEAKMVCFKSDNTAETGAMIIEELKKLGGSNDRNWEGSGTAYPFYYIDEDGLISCGKEIPNGYTLKKLPSKVKLNVGDIVKVKKNSRYRIANEMNWRGITFDGHFFNIDNLYIHKISQGLAYLERKDYVGNLYFVLEIENLELIESKIQEIKMKNRILTPTNAARIINIACSAWKKILAEKWAVDMILDKNIEISEESYKEMRKACTVDQHRLFDEIFGSDEQFIDISELAIGESMKVYDTSDAAARFKGIIVMRIWAENEEFKCVDVNNPRNTWCTSPKFKGKRVKLTITHEEVK